MSILITAIDHLKRVVYMAADHRSIDLDGNFVSDENTKIFQIREGVMLGVSGLSSEGLRMKQLLMDNKYLSASELIGISENFQANNIIHDGQIHGTTFVMAGIYDDGKPFIWCKTTHDKEMDEPEKKGKHFIQAELENLIRSPALSVSAPNQSTVNVVKPDFVANVVKTSSYVEAIRISIDSASRIDKAISPSFDLHTFDTATLIPTFNRIFLNQSANGK